MNSLPSFSTSSRDQLLKLLAQNAYRYGEFTLTSGAKSKHYVNCKPISLSGFGLSLISAGLLQHVQKDASSVAGLTLGADPLVSGVAMLAAFSERPLNALIVRKEAKGHGTGQCLEGPLPSSGSIITVLEDVVTSGGSSLKAVRQLREAGFLVDRVVTIIDRQEGGETLMREKGIELVSLYRLDQVISAYKQLL